ncbi:hypothetical protein M501DRAFT_928761 [Patellaria atrata CBS 101060]|uniref:Uncharacterized protein n=1 Tax=Patellaria atrata CBS 101060 TaxID=1346257 RepID=A0A9P4VT59_9PEZI|nr:hypothetical protein M501DRAFT_928761 [Patellaria atrata CBS 101060]
MEAAIRWSPHATQNTPRFIIVDVAGNRLRLCEIESFEDSKVRYKQVALRDKLPNFTAFDWSKTQESIVGLGSASGEAILVQIGAQKSTSSSQSDLIHSFPLKHQRKCNSIAFSTKNYLATGLDKVRNDFCMNVYDLNEGSLSPSTEPYKKLASSEAITSIKFFPSQPDTLIAGVSRQCVRIYDLRDSAGIGAAQFPTRQVHNVAIDPLDENYFVTAGPSGDPNVCVWDRRFASRVSPLTPGEGGPAGSILDLRPAIDNRMGSTIWTLRFSGTRRGCFGILSNTGEVKIIELAEYTAKPSPQTVPYNSFGGSPWLSQHYTKLTHSLRYPYYHEHQGQDPTARVIAYDFMVPSYPTYGDSVLALHPSREIGVLKIPTSSPQLDITAMDELISWNPGLSVVRALSTNLSVAEDLIKLRQKAASLKVQNGSSKTQTSANEHIMNLSSCERHELLLGLGSSETSDFGDYLKTLSTQRRRCREGYSLKCRRNKIILQDDPWLVELWDTIGRMEHLAEDDGMVADCLDLSYLGVTAITLETFEPESSLSRLVGTDSFSPAKFEAAVGSIIKLKGYPDFYGASTEKPKHRQLGLALCGWTFSEEIAREQSMELIDRGEYYKAIVLAVFKGYKSVSLDLLKYCVQQRLVENIGLGAVIACDSVNEEQRGMCEWMAEESEDPYLTALLAYFVSGDWSVIAKMTQLSLIDRVGIALKYLEDNPLKEFLEQETSHATACGDIEGIILTGLDEIAITLFENYIAKFDDLQTAVLALSFTNPRYSPKEEERFELWKETYLMQMQSWRTFLERTRFTAQHNEKSVARDGRILNPSSGRQLSIRCNNCQQSLTLNDDRIYIEGSEPPTTNTAGLTESKSRRGPLAASGLVCPKCGVHMPRCGICMMWLGSPDPAKPGGAAALAEEDPMGKFMTFCMTCTHGFHAGHARDWFAKHAMCPVPDCQCMCGLRH